MFAVQEKQTHSMRTRDGVRLDADVYCPVGEGPFPVLLMRQPYGRAIASTIVYAHPRWYAAHGYIVVIQDVRGRGTSAGHFDLFAHEVNDGEDTLQWAAQLPHSDGQIGMYGFSYQGMTQLYAAQANVPALKTIVPAMTGYRLYEDWAYENGALCLQIGLTWALQLAAETARRQHQTSTYQQLVTATKHLPIWDSIPSQPAVLEDIDSFFHDWVNHPHADSYWENLTPQLKGIDLPTLHIGGWFDPYLRGDIRLYQELLEHSQSKQGQSKQGQHPHHLWIGPWNHIPWSRKVGALDFGRAAISPVDQLQVQWFDAILKGQKSPQKLLKGTLSEATEPPQHSALALPTLALIEDKPICLFEMGRNQWRRLSDWSARSTQAYFLHSDGLANSREDSGVLTSQSHSAENQDTVVHDPWNPAPSLGGHSAIPAGAFERTAVDARGDVLTYTSTPMTEELRVAGIVKLVGEIVASASSYDLCAVLSRVNHDGVYNLTQSYQKVETAEPNQPIKTVLPLHPTCFSIAPGECLRLSVSLACFPAYPINPGTGTPSTQSKLIDTQIISAAITIGGPNGMAIQIPIA